MPLKSLPFDYIDTGQESPGTESRRLAQEIDKLRAEGWVFLDDEQLDANFAEWRAAAEAIPLSPTEATEAKTTLDTLQLLHATPAKNLPNILDTQLLTSHHYRSERPDLYPPDEAFPPAAYPDPYETALGLDDYVCFSVEGYSHFAQHEGSVGFYVPARQLLEADTIVTPFDAPLYLMSTPLHERPGIIQAVTLRGRDYLQLLPQYIAATERGRSAYESTLPPWFGERFGGGTYKAAEIKARETVHLQDFDWTITYDSRDPQIEPQVRELLQDLGDRAIDLSQAS
jgi:hypothetical protein